ncbi:MAG: saccharopine dehydrogenase NADP-binding domain-containing protein, partial [Acidobacteria bacterium]|nr:saccharopine dehydrogenase NADP-binding domain-containing protein [Acidobacteriota bacterium]
MSQWMIYGATGYSGQLIAEEARSCGLKPILAGRSLDKLEPLGQQMGCEVRAFSLNDPEALKKGMAGVELVIHAAGPFSQTAEPMLRACLAQGCHYFDITGEMDIFEWAHRPDISAQASAQKMVVCPGVGFDVVPTDCVALSLKGAMPDATHLCLGFASKGKLSPGTAKTMLEGASKGTRNRRNGKIQPCALQTPTIDFGAGPLPAMSLAWGDISTAYHSTGIPNIDVFIATT